jgi:hypothetical protein
MAMSTNLDLCANQSSGSWDDGRWSGRQFGESVVHEKGEHQSLMVNQVQINGPCCFQLEIESTNCT